jgi:hypothetical protein
VTAAHATSPATRADPPQVDVLIERAEAVMAGVTEGPWVVNREGWACVSSGSDSVFHGYFEGSCGSCGDEILDEASVAISIEDAEFIASARTLVPELVEALKAAREELEWHK